MESKRIHSFIEASVYSDEYNGPKALSEPPDLEAISLSGQNIKFLFSYI